MSFLRSSSSFISTSHSGGAFYGTPSKRRKRTRRREQTGDLQQTCAGPIRKYNNNNNYNNYYYYYYESLLLLLASTITSCQPFMLHCPSLQLPPPSLLSPAIGYKSFSRRQFSSRPPSLLEDDSFAALKENVDNNDGDGIDEEKDNPGETQDRSPPVLSDTSINLQTQKADLTQDLVTRKTQEVELTSRRKMFHQCATFMVGSAVAGTALMAGNQQKQQREDSLLPFVRLEPYPSRQSKVSNTRVATIYREPKEDSRAVPNTTTTTSKFNATRTPTSTTTTTTNNNNTNTTPTPTTTNKRPTTNMTSIVRKGNKTTANRQNAKVSKPSTASSSAKSNSSAPSSSSSRELAPVNFTKVAAENSINITLKDCQGGCVRVNATSFQKVKVPEATRFWYLPKSLQPAPKVIKDIPDTEIILAATVAGSIIEMGRTMLLYPLSTIKTRIQTRQQEKMKAKRFRKMNRYQANSTLRISKETLSLSHFNNSKNTSNNSNNYTYDNTLASEKNTNTTSNGSHHHHHGITKRHIGKPERLDLRRRLRVLRLNIQRHIAEGNLYAGLVPSLLVSVPATGIYYSVRDVSKRALTVAADGSVLNDAVITLLGALVADVASLMVRTPADALAARLQAAAAVNKGSATTRTAASLDSSGGSSGSSGSIVETSNSSNSFTEAVTTAHIFDAAVNDTIEICGENFLGDSETSLPETIAPISQNQTISVVNSTVEEDWFREEVKHYHEKESHVELNTSQSIDKLFAAVLSAEFAHQEQFFLTQLQQREYNVKNVVQGWNDTVKRRGAGLSKRRLTLVKPGEAERIQLVQDRPKQSAVDDTVKMHLYTREFLDGSWKEEMEQEQNTTLSLTIGTMNVFSVVDSWYDDNQASNGKKSPTSRYVTVDEDLFNADALEVMDAIADQEPDRATAIDVSVNDEGDSAVIQMKEEEERALMNELRQENIYQEDWFRQSLDRLPAIIITDLPYLLSRIALNRIIIHGKVNIGTYEVETIAISIFCALLTTPFDVVRTRLLVDNDEDQAATIETSGKVLQVNQTDNETTVPLSSGQASANQGILQTMISIAKEGDGGVRNLYAGWLERTAYFGIGRAWLDPINIITYVGIRDTLLLQWFD